MIPFTGGCPAIRALKSLFTGPKICNASLTCCSVGTMTGIMELTKAFVILEDLPVTFMEVGILNSLRQLMFFPE